MAYVKKDDKGLVEPLTVNQIMLQTFGYGKLYLFQKPVNIGKQFFRRIKETNTKKDKRV